MTAVSNIIVWLRTWLGLAKSSHPETLPKNRQGWMNHWVAQMIELLDELGIQKAHLVGNSLGCSIALELLLEHPERFEKVVLMGPGGTPNTKLSCRAWTCQKGFYDNPSEKKMRQIMSWFVYDDEKACTGNRCTCGYSL